MNARRRILERCTAAFALVFVLTSPTVSANTQIQSQNTKPAQPIDNLVNTWLNRRELQHSFVGVEVMELPTGRVLFSSNGNRRFAPASTTKIMTTAAAFTLLGPAYVYKTDLVTKGATDDDTVNGDLVIVPSQDPTFSRLDLLQLLSKVTQNKIHTITGAVKLEPTPGGHDVFQPNWLLEDFGQEYMPVCSNFVVDRNIAQGLPALKGIHNVIEGPSEHFNGLHRSLLNSDVAAGWLTYDETKHEIKGFIGSGVTAKSPLPVSDPDEYNTALACDTLQQMGVKIGHPYMPISSEAPQKIKANGVTTPLAEHLSKPLSSVIQYCLHESDNLYAQQLVRTLGIPANGKPSGQALEDVGLGRMSRWMSSIGVPTEEAVLFDGCGLSRKNGISPHALNTVLKFMAGPNVDGPYLALLKKSGTSTGKGQFVFKTGSMDTVRSISGVLQTAGGQQIAVTIIVNDHSQSIKGLRGSFSELLSILDQIISISFIAPKPAPPGAPPAPATQAVVELTNERAPAQSRAKRSRRSRHH